MTSGVVRVAPYPTSEIVTSGERPAHIKENDMEQIAFVLSLFGWMGVALVFVILVVGAAAFVISLVISNSNMFDGGDTYDNYDK